MLRTHRSHDDPSAVQCHAVRLREQVGPAERRVDQNSVLGNVVKSVVILQVLGVAEHLVEILDNVERTRRPEEEEVIVIHLEAGDQCRTLTPTHSSKPKFPRRRSRAAMSAATVW